MRQLNASLVLSTFRDGPRRSFFDLPRKGRLRTGDDVRDIWIDASYGTRGLRSLTLVLRLDSVCQLLAPSFGERALALALGEARSPMSSHLAITSVQRRDRPLRASRASSENDDSALVARSPCARSMTSRVEKVFRP